MAISERWDIEALKAGASVAFLLAVPPTLIARFVIEDTGATSGWAPLLSLIAISGFIIGAGQSAWRQTKGTPLLHGMVTTTGVFMVTQSVFALIKISLGDDIRIGRILTSLSLAIVAGVIGGLLGSFLKHSGPAPRPINPKP